MAFLATMKHFLKDYPKNIWIVFVYKIGYLIGIQVNINYGIILLGDY